jgi:NAD(P)H dehydrogenase (quinone)
LGKEVHVQQVDDGTYADIMKGVGVPDFLIPLHVDIQKSIREGTLAVESNDFEKVLGRPATPISDALAQIVGDISKSIWCIESLADMTHRRHTGNSVFR